MALYVAAGGAILGYTFYLQSLHHQVEAEKHQNDDPKHRKGRLQGGEYLGDISKYPSNNKEANQIHIGDFAAYHTLKTDPSLFKSKKAFEMKEVDVNTRYNRFIGRYGFKLKSKKVAEAGDNSKSFGYAAAFAKLKAGIEPAKGTDVSFDEFAFAPILFEKAVSNGTSIQKVRNAVWAMKNSGKNPDTSVKPTENQVQAAIAKMKAAVFGKDKLGQNKPIPKWAALRYSSNKMDKQFDTSNVAFFKDGTHQSSGTSNIVKPHSGFFGGLQDFAALISYQREKPQVI